MAGRQSLDNLGASRIDLEVAAHDRLLDAEALFEAERYASSMAMGLYALEITLKVAICRRLDLDNLPTVFEVHDFEGLLVVAGLLKRLKHSSDDLIKVNWQTASAYGSRHFNEFRYLPSSLRDRREARDLLDCLQSSPSGVIPWITAQL